MGSPLDEFGGVHKSQRDKEITSRCPFSFSFICNVLFFDSTYGNLGRAKRKERIVVNKIDDENTTTTYFFDIFKDSELMTTPTTPAAAPTPTTTSHSKNITA